MKRKIIATLALAAGAAGAGLGGGAATASAAELPLLGSASPSDRTLLPGVPVPYPEALVEPSKNLSSALTPVVAPA